MKKNITTKNNILNKINLSTYKYGYFIIIEFNDFVIYFNLMKPLPNGQLKKYFFYFFSLAKILHKKQINLF